MIEMENITKSYMSGGNSVPILKGITLHIGAGEFVSIMGPSGSGKSTLSSILGCLSKPSGGSYRLDNKEITKMSGDHLALIRNRKIGFVFQDFNLLDGLTTTENVGLPLIYAGVSASERKKRSVRCLERVGLGHKTKSLPNQLSGGQKQRVAIARALVTDPMLIFADEPTGALDKKTGTEIMALLQELNLLGQTVVQVTHSAEHALYSKRILHLVDGLVVKDELVARPIIAVAQGAESVESSEMISHLWRIVQRVNKPMPEDVGAVKELFSETKSTAGLVEALRALAKWPGEESDRILKELFSHSDSTIRAEFLRAVEGKGENYFKQYCWQALTDSNAWVRFLAVSMLKRLTQSPSDTEKNQLLVSLEDPDERVRATAAVLLGMWRYLPASEKLISATEDADGRVRANSLEALVTLGLGTDERVRECLKKGLGDKNNRARANAARFLFASDPGSSMHTLKEMLESENNLLRASAAWAVAQVSVSESGPLLFSRLQRETNELVTSQLVSALAQMTSKGFTLKQQIALIIKHEPLGEEDGNVPLPQAA